MAKHYEDWASKQRAFIAKKGYIKKLVAVFGRYKLHELNTQRVEQYQTAGINRGLKPATVNRELACLKHMLTKAVDWEMVGDEIREKVRRVRQLPENNRRLRFLSREEINSLINSCNALVRPIVFDGTEHGDAKRRDPLGLRWENVDLRHGLILLDRTKNNERREIPINESLRVTAGINEEVRCAVCVLCSSYRQPLSGCKRFF